MGVFVVLLHKPLITINHVPYDTLKSLKTKLENSSMNEIKAWLQVSEYVKVAGTVLSSRDMVVVKIGMVPILKQSRL